MNNNFKQNFSKLLIVLMLQILIFQNIGYANIESPNNKIILLEEKSISDDIKYYKVNINNEIISEITESYCKNGDIIINAKEGNLENKLIIKENGDMYLDGNKVIITKSADIIPLYNNIFSINPKMSRSKGAGVSHSTSPFFGTASQYNIVGSKVWYNINLGRKVDEITVSILSTIIGGISGSVSYAVTAYGLTSSIINTAKKVSPKDEAFWVYEEYFSIKGSPVITENKTTIYFKVKETYYTQNKSYILGTGIVYERITN